MKFTEYQKVKCFDSAAFENPSAFASPVYSWVWNSPISEELIKEQLDEMQEEGIRAFYIIPEPKEFRPATMRTTMEPDYLTDVFLRLVRFTAEEAKRRGMVMWLYDEGGWPSGSAAGRVVDTCPDGIAKRLREKEITLKASETLEEDGVFAAFKGEERVNLPFTAKNETALRVYDVEEINKNSPNPKLPHLIDEKAVEEFLRSTHEKYKKAMGEYFADGLYAMFTDEAMLFYPYYWEDREEWEKETGWNLRDMIPALFGDFRGDEGKRFRVAYIDKVSRVLAERYLKRIRTWCRENDLLFTGHMDGDHRLSAFRSHGGNLLLHLRMMDLPGVDCIWRQIFPGQRNDFFPRFASSAATQVGSNYAMSETFAVYGDGVTFDQMRWVAGYQAVRGINILNLMSVTSGREGFLSAQCRPHFVKEKENMHFLGSMNAYWERLYELLSLGKRSPRAALYVPERGVWAGEDEEGFYALGNRLEEHQIDFDLVDDVFLEEAAIDDGAFVMKNARYDVIFVPKTDWMSEKAKARLASFDGKVYGEDADEMTLSSLAVIPCSSEKLRASERRGEGFRLVMLWNESTKAETFRVTLPGDYPYITRLDPVSGEKTRLYPGEKEFLLAGGEELMLYFSEEKIAAEQEKTYEKVLELSPPALYTESLTKLEDGRFIRVQASGEAVKTPFSGVAKASFTFQAEKKEDLLLSFPESGIPLRVSLNGETVGDTLFPPYRLTLPGDLLKEQNEVTLTYFGNAAKAILDADLSAYPSNVIGPYHYKHTFPSENEEKAPFIGRMEISRIL